MAQIAFLNERKTDRKKKSFSGRMILGKCEMFSNTQKIVDNLIKEENDQFLLIFKN